MADKMLGYDEAAEFLGVKTATLYSLVSRKRIPHVRYGRRFVRFRESDLERWLCDREVAAKEAGNEDTSLHDGTRRSSSSL